MSKLESFEAATKKAKSASFRGAANQMKALPLAEMLRKHGANINAGSIENR